MSWSRNKYTNETARSSEWEKQKHALLLNVIQIEVAKCVTQHTMTCRNSVTRLWIWNRNTSIVAKVTCSDRPVGISEPFNQSYARASSPSNQHCHENCIPIGEIALHMIDLFIFFLFCFAECANLYDQRLYKMEWVVRFMVDGYQNVHVFIQMKWPHFIYRIAFYTRRFSVVMKTMRFQNVSNGSKWTTRIKRVQFLCSFNLEKVCVRWPTRTKGSAELKPSK